MTDMQHHLFGSGHDVDLWLNYRSIRRVPTRGARCWQNKCHALTESKVITEKCFSLKRLFLEFFLFAGQSFKLGSNLRSPQRKSA